MTDTNISVAAKLATPPSTGLSDVHTLSKPGTPNYAISPKFISYYFPVRWLTVKIKLAAKQSYGSIQKESYYGSTAQKKKNRGNSNSLSLFNIHMASSVTGLFARDVELRSFTSLQVPAKECVRKLHLDLDKVSRHGVRFWKLALIPSLGSSIFSVTCSFKCSMK